MAPPVSLEKGIYFFREFSPLAVAAFSTRAYEASQDLPAFLKSLGSEPKRACVIEQVHGDRVVLASGSFSGEEADGLLTHQRQLALVIRTADCAPVFLLDPRAPAVALCHAGWRGAHLGIAGKAMELFRSHFGSEPARLQAAIGPTICSQCYEVGAEFEQYFPGRVRKEGPRRFFDLKGFLKSELVERGVPQNSIVDSGICTSCETDRFFSARREGQETGRFLSAIMLK